MLQVALDALERLRVDQVAQALLADPSFEVPLPELAESYGGYVAHRMVYEGAWDDDTTREELFRYVLARGANRDPSVVRIQGLGLVDSFLQQTTTPSWINLAGPLGGHL